jgi:gamma-glutamyl hydrolase
VDIKSSKVNYLYVRWLEQSRAEVVVIQPWYTKNQVEEILSKVNGVLWPGGDRNLIIGGQFENVAKYILDYVINLFDTKGVILPLWGTCQGFELLHVLFANSTDVLTKYKAFNIRSPIEINYTTLNSTKMFQDFSEKDLYNIQHFDLNAQFHNLGVDEIQYEKYPILKNIFTITSYGKDLENKTYINSVESLKYPLYAVQFHPEMIPYTKTELEGIPQSIKAIKISQLFSNFYVNELFKNNHTITYNEMNKFDYLDSYKKIPELLSRGYYYTFYKKDDGIFGNKMEISVGYSSKNIKKNFRLDI